MCIRRVLSTIRNMSQKISYPSAERNKSFILEVLQKHFDTSQAAKVVEISSGTGQHAAYFAQQFPTFTFYPSEFDESLLDSIKAYADDTPTKNVKHPVNIDVTTQHTTWSFNFDKCDYMININMMHISPPECTTGLFVNAGKFLKPGGLMITYGPYAHNGVITPQSNIDFHHSLMQRNPKWGLKDINDLVVLAAQNGIKLLKKYDLPANNNCLVWQKQ